MILTQHAQRRMQSRHITQHEIELVIERGRTYYARGAVFKVVGRKEADRHGEDSTFENLNGVHVVLSHDGNVITTYRNRRFRRADFRKPRRHWVRHFGQPRPWLVP